MIEDVRVAIPDDLAVLAAFAELAREELRAERDGQTWAALDARRDPVLADFGAQLADPGVRVVLATIDGVAVGYGVAFTLARADGARHGRVSDLFVLEDARQIGLGASMLEALSAWCLEQGCVGVDAFALPGARETKNFFETCGFVARSITVHRRLQEDGSGGRPSAS